MRFVALAAALLVAAASPAPSAAQQLPSGTWSGTMTPPGGSPLEVTFQVGEVDGALAMVMRRDPEGDMPLRDVRLAGDELTFWWFPGVRVECTLRRAGDGSFEGPCSDGTSARGDGAI